MANDCLIKKLAASVNNRNIAKLGQMDVVQRITSSSNNKSYFYFHSNSTIDFVNCTYNGQTSKAVTANPSNPTIIYASNFVLDEGETVAKYRVFVKDLIRFQLYSSQVLDATKLAYATNSFESFALAVAGSGNGFTGKTEVLANLGILLELPGITEGDYIDVTEFGNIGKSWCFNYNKGTKFIGSLNNMGKKVDNTAFVVPTTKKVTIELEEFVRNAVAAEVTTKTLSMGSLLFITATFNGNAVGTYDVDSLAWEPAGSGQTQVSLNGTVLGTISNTI